MKKELKTKILDLRFTIERLEAQCDEQQQFATSAFLHQAMSALEKAAERCTFISEPSSLSETVRTVHFREVIKKSSKLATEVAVQFKTRNGI
jgi:hypothetical protein